MRMVLWIILRLIREENEIISTMVYQAFYEPKNKKV